MGISITVTQSWARGGESLSKSITIAGSSEANYDMGFVASGQVQAFNGDQLPALNKLAVADFRFAGDVTLKTHLSGSYLSGAVGTQLELASGVPYQFIMSGGLTNPFFPATTASGQVSVIAACTSGYASV